MKFRFASAAALVIAVGAAALAAKIYLTPAPKQEASIITISTIDKIVHVSELSTFSAVYNGIAEVKNESDSEKTDYYVAYEAKVKAGLDFNQIQSEVDEENKTVKITLPDITIQDVNVDIASMDFIFVNKKLNQSAVSADAFRACEQDAEQESAEKEDIYELAKQNAVNVVTALTQPIVEQLDDSYTLEVS